MSFWGFQYGLAGALNSNTAIFELFHKLPSHIFTMYLKARATFKGLESFPPSMYSAVEEKNYFIRGKGSHPNSQGGMWQLSTFMEAWDWHHLPPTRSWNQAGASDGISLGPRQSLLLLVLLQQLLAVTRNHGNAKGLKVLLQCKLVFLGPWSHDSPWQWRKR